MIFFSFVCISDSDIYCLLFFRHRSQSPILRRPIIKNFSSHLVFTIFFFSFFSSGWIINWLIFVCLFLILLFLFSEISHYRMSRQSCRFSAKIKDMFLEAVEAVVFSRVKDHQRLLRIDAVVASPFDDFFFSLKHLKFHDWIFSSWFSVWKNNSILFRQPPRNKKIKF